MKRIILITLLLSQMTNLANAQAKPDSVRAVIYEGDTIPYVMLHVADVFGMLSPEAAENLKKYYRLRRDVLRTYPYARHASALLKEMNDHLATLSKERERKRYAKEKEKELKAVFGDDLKKLTVNQGRILIKLIDRETGNTTYDVVKDLRGGFHAFMWQTVARFIGDNLKDEYDSEGEDFMIETIVKQIETGQLQIPAVYLLNKNLK